MINIKHAFDNVIEQQDLFSRNVQVFVNETDAMFVKAKVRKAVVFLRAIDIDLPM